MREPPITRPEPPVRTRPGYTLRWVTNIAGADLLYWAGRNELEAHIFRKRYMQRWYDTTSVILGEPAETTRYTTETLAARSIIGVYGWRVTKECE